MRRIGTMFILALSVLLFASTLCAQPTSTTVVPSLIRYSATLKTSQGSAISSNTPFGVTFAIYKQQDGGAPIWQETQNVTTDASGSYSVLLGSTTASGLPDDLFSQQEQRWLGVQLQGEAEQPRVLMVSVPYAFKAQEAETLGGLPASAFVKAPPTDGSGGTYVGVPGNASQPGGLGDTRRSGVGIDTVVNCATSANNYVPVFTSAAPPNIVICNSVMYQLNSNLGVGNTAPVAKLDVNGNINTSLAYQIGETTVLSAPAGNNLFVGPSAGIQNTGSNNTFVGFQAGQSNTTGSSDVYVSNAGPASGTESNAIRIGSSQTAAYIAGVYGASTSGGSAVFIDSTGKLGTTGGAGGIVTSFNGRAGAVVPAAADYSFSLLSGTLGSSQLGGTYSSAVTLSNASNAFSGSFSGSGGGLTGIQFSQLGGTLGSTQFSGTYSVAVKLSNTSNVFYGDGSNLTGVLPAPGSSNYIQNGTSKQSNASFNISGSGTIAGTATASVVNALNSTTNQAYQIAGNAVLGIGSPADANLFLGVGAGAKNVAGTGLFNTFSGYQAGNANTTGVYNTFTGSYAGQANTGSGNTFMGTSAGRANTTGHDNTFSGLDAGYSNTDGYENTFSGSNAGFTNNYGYDNTFSGYLAGYSNLGGIGNTFTGDVAGYANTSGNENTFSGHYAGANITGAANTFFGAFAGSNNTTGNNNIYLGNPGCNSPCGESNTIRVGGDVGSGYGAQTAAYIAGIYGVTASGGVPVYINSNWQLGTLTSSRRFKEQIADMGDSTSSLMKLRPVTFLYKPEYDKGERTLQYGLIAEEVAEVYPELVASDKDGRPYTVKYQYLSSMLLNEVQKQHAVVAAQQDVIQTQQEEIQTQRRDIAGLQQRLSRLESLIAKK